VCGVCGVVHPLDVMQVRYVRCGASAGCDAGEVCVVCVWCGASAGCDAGDV